MTNKHEQYTPAQKDALTESRIQNDAKLLRQKKAQIRDGTLNLTDDYLEQLSQNEHNKDFLKTKLGMDVRLAYELHEELLQLLGETYMSYAQEVDRREKVIDKNVRIHDLCANLGLITPTTKDEGKLLYEHVLKRTRKLEKIVFVEE